VRPPICAICGKRFDEHVKLLGFALSDAERESNKRFEKQGFGGHPAGLEWFCGIHAAIAEKYLNLTKAEAMIKIREEIEAEIQHNTDDLYSEE